jgi:cysteine desulfurase/selenocysteine lyase
MGQAAIACAGCPLPARLVRQDFPVLEQTAHGRPLVYLDSANTTQKPRAMIDALRAVYETCYANVHRGTYEMAVRAEEAYEATRGKLQRFLNARDRAEIVFVRGTTEAINLVAQSYGRSRVKAGDEVLISAMEHHSNIVPWQLLCKEKGARLRVAPISDRGEIVLEEMERLMGPRTRLVAVGHVSNALGTVNPVRRIVDLAHARGIPVLVDGAQAAPHLPVDVQALGCDFYAFSAHKTFGPSGLGVLYGRAELLETMPPWQAGGDMILSVNFEETTFNAIPQRFEAGTPHIAGAIAFGATLDYLSGLGMDRVAAHEAALLDEATTRLAAVPGLRLIGTARERAGVVSFVLDGIHPHDVGTVLDHEGIAVRTGHHCAQPVMAHFGVPATVRASFALYNTSDDVDALLRGLERARETFL